MTKRMAVGLHALATVVKAGMIGPESPATLLAMARAMRDYGTVGGAIAVAAPRRADPALAFTT